VTRPQLLRRIAPAQNAWNLVTRRPKTRLAAFPNMGHAMLPEQPESNRECGDRFHQPPTSLTGSTVP